MVSEVEYETYFYNVLNDSGKYFQKLNVKYTPVTNIWEHLLSVIDIWNMCYVGGVALYASSNLFHWIYEDFGARSRYLRQG